MNKLNDHMNHINKCKSYFSQSIPKKKLNVILVSHLHACPLEAFPGAYLVTTSVIHQVTDH